MMICRTALGNGTPAVTTRQAFQMHASPSDLHEDRHHVRRHGLHPGRLW